MVVAVVIVRKSNFVRNSKRTAGKRGLMCRHIIICVNFATIPCGSADAIVTEQHESEFQKAARALDVLGLNDPY